jgi:Protein of unknown function (DUF2797)
VGIMWRCTGTFWRDGRPGLAWSSDAAGTRERPLPSRLALTTGAGRSCVGVHRAGQRTPCPAGAAIPGSATSAQCAACAAVDRSYSVAADTALDDRRTFRLYLAWFGPGLLKLGITAAERGEARLLEQGALAHTWLGEGRLPAVRRAERVLGAALGIPDRFGSRVKRSARAVARPRPDAELTAAHQAANSCPAWPDTLLPLPASVTDHCATYGLDPVRPIRPTAEVTSLHPHSTVAGTITSVVGKDAHLETPHGLLLLDLRLLTGWDLTRADPSRATDAAVRAFLPEEEQNALF